MSKSSVGLSVNMLKEQISSLENQKAELEEKVEALSSIQNKISEITGKARSDDETHTCSEFVSLLEVFLQSIVNGTDNWRSMITEIVSSSVGPCTTEDLENLESIKDATEAYSKDIEDEIINITDRIEKLNAILALRATSEPATQITSTIVTTTQITPISGSYNSKSSSSPFKTTTFYITTISTSLPRETAIKISPRFYSTTKLVSSSPSRSTGYILSFSQSADFF